MAPITPEHKTASLPRTGYGGPPSQAPQSGPTPGSIILHHHDSFQPSSNSGLRDLNEAIKRNRALQRMRFPGQEMSFGDQPFMAKLPKGWSVKVQPDGVRAYTNQNLKLGARFSSRQVRSKTSEKQRSEPSQASGPQVEAAPIESLESGKVTAHLAETRTPKPDLDSRFPPDDPPPGVSIEKNMATAKSIYESLPNHRRLKWFRQMVQNGGPWDFKQIAARYEPFGNYHYGAVGKAAGIDENYLLRLAGWAQHKSGTSRPEWGKPWGAPPYGDDPRDQRRIRQGFAYASRKGY